VTKKEITGWKTTVYVKPNTSITFTKILKRHIPNININKLEKKRKGKRKPTKQQPKKTQEKISIPGLWR